VVFLESDSIGRGSETGANPDVLLLTRLGSGVKPAKVIMVNGGVKLACEGSKVLETCTSSPVKGRHSFLRNLPGFFGLKARLKAGRISNMYEILSSLAQAGKV